MKLYIITYYDYSVIAEYLIFNDPAAAIQQFARSVKSHNRYEVTINEGRPSAQDPHYYEETVIARCNRHKEVNIFTEEPELIEKINKAIE